MAQNITQTNQSPKINKHHIFKIAVAAIAIIVLLVVSLYLFKKPNPNNAKTTGPLKYSYSKLDSYSLLGPVAGDGISFKKPVEITGPDTQAHLNIRLSQNMFFQFIKIPNTKMGAQAGVLMVETVPTPQPISADSLKTIQAQAKISNSSTAKSFQKTLDTFVSQRLTNYKVSMGNLRTLTSANLSNNAWVANYTATATSQKNLYPDSQGQAMVAIGQHGYYYFAIQTVNYNWTANQQIWDQVFNSIKIDQ